MQGKKCATVKKLNFVTLKRPTCGTVCNPCHKERVEACKQQVTHPTSIYWMQITPQNSRHMGSVTTQSQHSVVYLHFTFLRLLKHSQVCSVHPFLRGGAPFPEVGGGRRDSTFVSSTHQSHLLQVHTWGCALPLERFTIYQLNRQMLNHFLHLLNLCCFRQPANTTHSTLSREAASKHAIP